MPKKDINRSKLTGKHCSNEKLISLKEVCQKWDELADMIPNKTNKSAVILMRKDRKAH